MYDHGVIIPLYFLLGITSAIVFALLEIQIEGPDGWARKLPTWRRRPWFMEILPGGKKELTGYHLYLWIFLFVYPRIVFVFTPWSVSKELFLWSYIVFVMLLEDFLWFVLNPYFGMKKFRKEHIPWHADWRMGIPTVYYYVALLWLLLVWSGFRWQ